MRKVKQRIVQVEAQSLRIHPVAQRELVQIRVKQRMERLDLDAIGADSSRSAGTRIATGAIPRGTGGPEAGSCRSPQDELRLASRRRGGPRVNDQNLQSRKGGTK